MSAAQPYFADDVARPKWHGAHASFGAGTLEGERFQQRSPSTRVVARCGATELVVEFKGAAPHWAAPVAQRLCELLDLPKNWDSYGSDRVDYRAAEALLRILSRIGEEVALPGIFPTSGGGMQLEWSSNGIEVVVSATPSGEVTVSVDSPQLDVESTFSSVALVPHDLVRQVSELVARNR